MVAAHCACALRSPLRRDRGYVVGVQTTRDTRLESRLRRAGTGRTARANRPEHENSGRGYE